MSKQDCGCKVMANTGVKDWGYGSINDLTWIEYCPLHAAAGELLRTLETLLNVSVIQFMQETRGDGEPNSITCFKDAYDIIARAKGQQHVPTK